MGVEGVIRAHCILFLNLYAPLMTDTICFHWILLMCIIDHPISHKVIITCFGITSRRAPFDVQHRMSFLSWCTRMPRLNSQRYCKDASRRELFHFNTKFQSPAAHASGSIPIFASNVSASGFVPETATASRIEKPPLALHIHDARP